MAMSEKMRQNLIEATEVENKRMEQEAPQVVGKPMTIKEVQEIARLLEEYVPLQGN